MRYKDLENVDELLISLHIVRLQRLFVKDEAEKFAKIILGEVHHSKYHALMSLKKYFTENNNNV